MNREDNVVFDEEKHTYTFKPTGESFTGVTTFIHKFIPTFDPDAIIDKMMASPHWATSLYFGQTKDEIKAKWKREGEEAAKEGTLMHARIESTLRGEETDWTGQEKERDKFMLQLESLEKEGYKPYKLEWKIYSETAKIMGTLDALFVNEEGKYILIDWKRSKNIKTNNPWQNLLEPLNKLEDCNYNHYTLQLNLYRWILETHYDIVIDEMRLYSFHPLCQGEGYYKIKRWDDEIKMILEF